MTPSLPIERGTFHGDTMSPMIFLLVMSPILHLAANWEYQGFRPLLPLPGTEPLPPKDSTVYVLWDEPDSSEPKGWYLVTICDYLLDGKAVLRYPGGETEELHLHSVQWILARKNGKHFRECTESLPKPPKSAPNRIKLRVKSIRQKPLQMISLSSTPLQATIRAPS